MPSRHYRRRVRDVDALNNSYTIGTSVTNMIVPPGDCELVKMYKKFYDIMDLVINSFNVTDAVSNLHNVIDTFTTNTDYYKLMEHIENDLLSTVSNISHITPLNIIKARIEYIKTFIDAIPSTMCFEIGPVASMTADLLDLITKQADYSSVKTNLTQMFNLVNETYPNIEIIKMIQDNICGVIQNIIDGAGKNIVELRINYIRGLIEQMASITSSV